jgi:hypothetical protein
MGESSVALGFGFRCGFLGLLHMEIIQERLRREFNMDVISTYPSVIYEVRKTDGEEINVDNPSILPEPQEIDEIRENGYIGKFAGAPVVVIPNSFEDENNDKLVFDPRFAYVIPAGKEKIVKVALVGQTIIDEWKNTDRSMEIQGYKKIGVGIVSAPNYWGIYYNSGIDAWGHDEIQG